MHSNLCVIACLLLSGLIVFGSPSATLAQSKKQSWTIQNSNQAADLAVASIVAPPGQDHLDPADLVQFACLLGTAGNVPRAKALLFQAMALAAPPNDDFLTRVQAIQAFMILHDRDDATKLANIQTEGQEDAVYKNTLDQRPSCDPNAMNDSNTSDSYIKPANWDYRAALQKLSAENLQMRVQDEENLIIVSAARSKNEAAAAYAMPFFMTDVNLYPHDASWGDFVFEDLLLDAATELAEAGMKKEAEIPYTAAQTAMQDTSWMNRQQSTYLAIFAPVQAAMGDVSGALHSADLAGSTTDDAYDSELAVVTTMSFDGATSQPSPAEIMARLAQVKAALPKDMSFQKGEAVREIVKTLSIMGNIRQAIAVEALLEGDPGDSITQGYRDDALSAIASAQVDTGDPSGALATIARINDFSDRWDPLIDLAATPIQN